MPQHPVQTLPWGSRAGVILRRACVLGLGSAGLAACAATAPVNPSFPTPLLDPLPLTVGVVYDEAFRSYEHVEVIPDEREWTVELGAANVALFDEIFGAMFAETVQLPDPNATAAPPAEGDGGARNGASGVGSLANGTAVSIDGLDAVIVPTIESYEMTGPKELNVGDGFYSVWITYRMRLVDSQGREIAEWPVRAVGKSLPRFLAADEAVAEATTMAMRDAGAYLALKFASEPRIREWLRESGKLVQSYDDDESTEPGDR